jgi:hypothetical protein
MAHGTFLAMPVKGMTISGILTISPDHLASWYKIVDTAIVVIRFARRRNVFAPLKYTEVADYC